MNSMKSKNTVASILQMYAYLNAIGGIILALILAGSIEGMAFIVFVITLIASFFIYALGEIIELLNAIKLNTMISDADKEKIQDIQELPEI